MTGTGLPAYRSDTGASVGQMLMNRVHATPDREAYRYPSDSGWVSLTWQQTADTGANVGRRSGRRGRRSREQRVGIASLTRFEWVIADLAIMCAGAATTTVYQTHPGRGRHLHPG